MGILLIAYKNNTILINDINAFQFKPSIKTRAGIKSITLHSLKDMALNMFQ